jgi:molybdenum cofactor cytidylyltransferase
VLAAGAGSRFSGRPGEKLLAPVEGRPMLARILVTLREHGPAATVVVLGHGGQEIEGAIDWTDEIRVRNPHPEQGIATSLAIGFEALRALPIDTDGAFVVLGDQPTLRAEVLEALAGAAADPGTRDRPFVVPRYADDPGPRNPVLVRREGWPLLAGLRGDHGLAPLIAQHPELCLDVPVPGQMPDIDRPQDLEALRRPHPEA